MPRIFSLFSLSADTLHQNILVPDLIHERNRFLNLYFQCQVKCNNNLWRKKEKKKNHSLHFWFQEWGILMFVLYFSCTWNVIFIFKYVKLNNMSILCPCLIFLDHPYLLQFLTWLLRGIVYVWCSKQSKHMYIFSLHYC
jgi:hypothetical protein